MTVTGPFYLVGSCTLDASALRGYALCLPLAHSVPSSSVDKWHWKREYMLCQFTVSACYDHPVLKILIFLLSGCLTANHPLMSFGFHSGTL